MRTVEDPKWVAHKREVEAARREKAIMRERAKRARAASAMAAMADPSLRRQRKTVD